MNFNQALNSYKGRVEKELKDFFDEHLKRVEAIDKSAEEVMEHLREYNLRNAKRIRPILTIIGYKAFGGKNEEEIIKASIAIELMQSFFLVHDDIMDQDEMRRGYYSFHKVYENKAKRHFKNTDAERYGENMAINAGDMLSMLSNEVLLNADFPSKLKLKAIRKLNRVAINTCIGQLLDINSEVLPEINETDVEKIHRLKTAVYTIEGPLHIGAILAGADEKDLALLSKFAMPLGQAFQVQDDILGMFGDEKKIGKPADSDLKEGKKTLLIIKALKKADENDKKIILNALGNENITKKDVGNVRDIIIRTGSLEHSKKLAEFLINKAKNIINESGLEKEAKEFLVGMADYMLNREY